MVKAIAVNASPRRHANTARLLCEALKGAASQGADTHFVHLWDLDFQGCCSCFGCKRKGARPFYCYQKDDLSPLLDEILAADVLLLGSPIYVGDITGRMRNFLERLAFITLSYDNPQAVTLAHSIDSAFFFTMGITPAYAKIYDPIIQCSLNTLNWLGGTKEAYICTDTLQFDDYSKYNAASMDENAKRAWHEKHFPIDLAAAYEIGARLSADAGKRKICK